MTVGAGAEVGAGVGVGSGAIEGSVEHAGSVSFGAQVARTSSILPVFVPLLFPLSLPCLDFHRPLRQWRLFHSFLDQDMSSLPSSDP